MTTLYRPVGLHELALIRDSGMRSFLRDCHSSRSSILWRTWIMQPRARDWNTKDNSFAGYVTKFAVADSFLANFEPRTVGSATHVEYWIPAEQLAMFNASIQGTISVEFAFFGSGFKGFVPDGFGLRGKDAVEQFATMRKTWDYSRMDFVCEVSTNRKAVYLNFLFWAQYDFVPLGVDTQQRDSTIAHIREAWEFNHIGTPLPAYR